MAVLLETSIGNITIDLYTEERPTCCKNFLKLCKIKYYNFCLFHSVQRNLVAQTGDPTGSGKGGESVYGLLYGDQAKYFDMEFSPRLKHKKVGTVSMVNNGSNMHGSQVALSRRAVKTSLPPPICTLEISQYGIRMYDKSKTGHEELDTFAHFFALKYITFCGHHPRNERYFAFITKHPNEYRYACHVCLGEKSTHTVTDAVGQAFKRFYQEYMAFTHPTEDIYME